MYAQTQSAAASGLVAIVGRPNVGKSTLFNRLTRSRRAIVGNEPGITRDRLYGAAEWRGHLFRVVDTGGILPGDEEVIPEAIFKQARVAINHADLVLFVVDGRSAPAAPDLELARLLLRAGKPVFLLVNKVDSDKQEHELAPYFELGIDPVLPVSAEHGRGVDDLLDRIIDRLPQAQESADALESSAEAAPRETRIAIVGRPNVGKSTLLNAITGEERSIVSEIPGTTRDAVDALVTRDGHQYRFIDTAGIRRKGKTKLMAEKLSVVMARKHLELADVALILIDATEGAVALDATIAGYATEAAKSCVIVVNKWDVARERRQRMSDFEATIRRGLKFMAWAPVVFISAQTGHGLPKLFVAIDGVVAARGQRISTAELNRFLATVDLERATVPRDQRVKIYYISQVRASPPTFVLFVDRPRRLHFSYERFLENQLRRRFGFQGTPIVFKVRASK